MEYDPSRIKKEKRIINGKEVYVQVVPTGMHGKGWTPDMFDHLPSEYSEEESEVNETVPVVEEEDLKEEDSVVDIHERYNELD